MVGFAFPPAAVVTGPIAIAAGIGAGGFAGLQMGAAYEGGGPDTLFDRADYGKTVAGGVEQVAKFIPGPVGAVIGGAAGAA